MRIRAFQDSTRNVWSVEGIGKLDFFVILLPSGLRPQCCVPQSSFNLQLFSAVEAGRPAPASFLDSSE